MLEPSFWVAKCHEGDFMKQAGVTVKSKGYWNAPC